MRIVKALGACLACLPAWATAEVELTPFAGFRLGGELDVRAPGVDSRSRLEFNEGESFGVIVNVDLDSPGKQAELYYGRHQTTAQVPEALFQVGTTAFGVAIDQLQFGGLYFPGGNVQGGYVSGVIGVTRLDPEPSNLETHYRGALALGGGFKVPLNDNLRLRLDLRGIYTALDTGGTIFCSGGCRATLESNGYFQVEAGLGLVFRF